MKESRRRCEWGEGDGAERCGAHLVVAGDPRVRAVVSGNRWQSQVAVHLVVAAVRGVEQEHIAACDGSPLGADSEAVGSLALGLRAE